MLNVGYEAVLKEKSLKAYSAQRTINCRPTPKVAIITVNYNKADTTRYLVNSFLKLEYNNFFIVAVDNGSNEQDLAKLAVLRSRKVSFLMIDKNKGFAGGNNVGIRYALDKGADYILMVNNDVKLLNSNFLKELVSHAEKFPEIGIIGPKVYENGGKVQRTRLYFPTLLNAFWHGYLGFQKHDYSRSQEVDALSGCCLLVRSKAVKEAGLLDEKFFMYAEEIEWCYRMKKRNWKIKYFPADSVLHLGNRSMRREPPTMHILKRSNLIYILVKHGFLLEAFLLALFTVSNHLIRVILSKIRIVSSAGNYNFFLIKALARDMVQKWRSARSDLN